VVSQIENPYTQQQMSMPIAVAYMLPVGVKGLLCAILLMGVFGGDATHLHSWGGIFVQDILVPLRKKPFGTRQHILVLRASMIGVAVFAFLFGSLFPQMEYVVMWWTITTAIYVGGAGAAIIGGLYWKKGTTAGAWTALITGSGLATSGILARLACNNHFPLNCAQISFYSFLTAIAVYMIVSLLTCKEDFNLDRMLHRGEYAIAGALADQPSEPTPPKPSVWQKLLGFDDRYTRGDRWIAGVLLGWSLFWFAVAVIGSLWNLVSPWPVSAWSTYWHITSIGLPIFICVATAFWFTWGGIRDIRALFRHLREERVCHTDDGTVVNHTNLDEALPTEKKFVPN